MKPNAGEGGIQARQGRWSARAGAYVILAATLIIEAGLFTLVSRLNLPPRGLNDLILAGNAGAVGRLLTRPEWADTGPMRTAISLDYFFIASYVVAIGAAALWAGQRLESKWTKMLARPAAGAILLSGLLDVIENIGVSRMLDGNRGNWPVVTTAVGWPKFFLFALAFIYAAAAVISWVKSQIQVRLQVKNPGRSVPGSFFLLPQSAPRMDESEFAEAPSWRKNDWEPPANAKRLGICCSGGGIRSAAYNLGALQALRSHGELEKAEYVTAVSGGAYIAAAHALTSVETAPEDRALFETDPAWALGSPEERHLRANTSYLAPDFAGKMRFVLRMLLGLLINVTVLWLALFVLSRPWGWVLGTPSVHPELLAKDHIGDLVVSAAMWAAIIWPAILGLALALFAVLRRFNRDEAYKATIRIGAAFIGLGLLELVLLVGLPWLGIGLPRAIGVLAGWLGASRLENAQAKNWVWLVQLAGLSAVGAAIARVAKKQAGRISMFVASLLVPLILLWSAGLLVVDGARRGMSGDFELFGWRAFSQAIAFAGGFLVLVGFYAISDQTSWSMHPFYKRRLFRAFAVKRERKDGRVEALVVDYDDPQLLSSYGVTAEWAGKRRYPELIVCAAANISERGIPTGRKAVSFTFGPSEVGGKDIGWVRTAEMERALAGVRKKDVTLPSAVAISGAALSPAMGKMTRPGVRSLMAIVNARLGVWIPNPRWMQRFTAFNTQILPPDSPPLDFRDRPRAGYWLKEIVGWHRKGDKFLYVTDGGHFENLGLVELLRRGCTEIYCFDAAGDHIDSFFTLGEAVALARTELDVEIDIDPEPMEPVTQTKDADPKERRSKCDVVKGTFTYRKSGVEGTIYYAKAAVTKAHPWDVKAYGEKDKEFPTHGTVSQLYGEARFEAYRALGYKTAERAIALRGGLDPCGEDEGVMDDDGSPLNNLWHLLRRDQGGAGSAT